MAEVALIRRWVRNWIGIECSSHHLLDEIAALQCRVATLENPPAKQELTAGDIAKRHEQKSSGRKPWRVMQREAELESSPEIQRERKTEKELKEIANA